MSDFTWQIPDAASSPAVVWSTIRRAVQQWFAVGAVLPGNHVIWRGSNRALPDSMWIELRLEGIDSYGQDVQVRSLNVIAVPTIAVSSIDPTGDTLAAPVHGRLTGDGPLRLVTTGTRPGNVPDVDLWAVVLDANTLKIATSFQLAVAGTAIDISSAGTGTITLVGTPTTTRAGQELTQRVQGPRTATLVARCYTGIVPGGDAATCMLVLDQAVAARELDGIGDALRAAGVGVGARSSTRLLGGTVNSSVWEPFAEVSVMLHFTSDIGDTGTYIEVVNTQSTFL